MVSVSISEHILPMFYQNKNSHYKNCKKPRQPEKVDRIDARVECALKRPEKVPLRLEYFFSWFRSVDSPYPMFWIIFHFHFKIKL